MNKKSGILYFLLLSLALGPVAFAGRIPASERPSVIRENSITLKQLGPDKVTQEQLEAIFDRVRSQGDVVRGRKTLTLIDVANVASNSAGTQNIILSIQGPRRLKVVKFSQYGGKTFKLSAIVNVTSGLVSKVTPMQYGNFRGPKNFTVDRISSGMIAQARSTIGGSFGRALKNAYWDLFGLPLPLRPVVKCAAKW